MFKNTWGRGFLNAHISIPGYITIEKIFTSKELEELMTVEIVMQLKDLLEEEESKVLKDIKGEQTW